MGILLVEGGFLTSPPPAARARPHTKSREHCTYQPSTFWRANCPPGATSRSDPIIHGAVHGKDVNCIPPSSF
eukprot:scaffold18104_cov94-Skeletonema_dohrnii-CCMP3373.AAC.2